MRRGRATRLITRVAGTSQSAFVNCRAWLSGSAWTVHPRRPTRESATRAGLDLAGCESRRRRVELRVPAPAQPRRSDNYRVRPCTTWSRWITPARPDRWPRVPGVFLGGQTPGLAPLPSSTSWKAASTGSPDSHRRVCAYCAHECRELRPSQAAIEQRGCIASRPRPIQRLFGQAQQISESAIPANPPARLNGHIGINAARDTPMVAFGGRRT